MEGHDKHLILGAGLWLLCRIPQQTLVHLLTGTGLKLTSHLRTEPQGQQ